MISALLSAAVMLAAGQTVPAQSIADADKAHRLCGSIAQHIDDEGGATKAPLFLRSYEPGPGERALPPPLASSAFSYDNALAIIALSDCGDLPRARRIADAFVEAVAHDRTFTDGRIRNAYRAGPIGVGPMKLPGWWDSTQNLWAEDPYQDGTQSGNVAWVALALLTLDEIGATSTYRPTAEALGQWITNHNADERQPSGYDGGFDGYDSKQIKLLWRSTEHNVDIVALGSWLRRIGDRALGDSLSRPALAFLNAMFDEQAGMFRLGAAPDGSKQPPDRFALDALIWPLAGVADAPSAWRRSLSFAREHLAVPGGYDFNGDRDGLWTEGTAQAAFIEGFIGNAKERRALLETARSLTAPSGYLYATKTGRITTGIAIGPTSAGEDFFYYHRPHLGATGWAILAATNFNPFTGRKTR